MKIKTNILNLDYNFTCNHKGGLKMRNNKNILLMATILFPLVLSGCNEPNNTSTESSSNESSSTESSSVFSSETKTGWSNESQELIIRYAGSLLPYPVNFTDDVIVRETADLVNNRTYLEILNESNSFVMADYYKDLEGTGWEGIRDYNDSIKQKDANGNVYYEFVKTSEDNKTGYNLTYFHSIDTSTSKEYDVIQCYNDLETEADESKEWDDEEKETFIATLAEVPPFLKFGKTNKVYQYDSNTLFCYDGYVKDLTKDNVQILKENGYELNEELSKENAKYTLTKTLQNNAKITAEVYYFSGNYVLFQYILNVDETSSWPEDFTNSLKEKTGFDLPSFESDDIETYYSYTKDNVNTIYAYTEDMSLLDKYTATLMNQGLVYDYERERYVDWHETFYVQTYYATDSLTSKNALVVTFATLSKAYDEFVEGWPTNAITNFLNENDLSVDFPSFDVSTLSKYSDYRYKANNYSDQYDYYYTLLKQYSDYFDIDPTDEEAIVAKAVSMAKNNTFAKIEVYDPAIKSEGDSIYYEEKHVVLDYFKETLKNACWCAVDSDSFTDGAYEDASGKLLIGFEHAYGVTKITFTYGNGLPHTPTFRFIDSRIGLKPGNVYNLQLEVQMLPYEITFSSDNENITVDNGGKVTVSENAKIGEKATITASMDVPNEGKRTITCEIVIADGYDIESAIQDVADSYNAYFNLDETDVGFAKPSLIDKSNPDEDFIFKYYEMVVATSFSSLDEAKTFVNENLIPASFKNAYDGEWSSPAEFDDGTIRQSVEYTWYDENYNGVSLTYFVYENPTTKAITIMVKSLAI